MDDFFYDKNVECPSCKNTFTTKKVRRRRLRLAGRDSDLNIRYKGINPLHYLVWICPNCGYSATESEYLELNKDEIKILEKKIQSKWLQRDFGGVRDLKQVEESYKLALITGKLLKKSRAYLASLCLRLAWFYREINEKEKEESFLSYALKFLEKAYEKEHLPSAGLDEITITYLIGELHRKQGNTRDAVQWYARSLEHPDIKNKRQIQILAREQWRLAREEGQGKV